MEAELLLAVVADGDDGLEVGAGEHRVAGVHNGQPDQGVLEGTEAR